MTKKLLMGNEAMAHAALEAGVRVVAGYPGTPSSEIVETVARLHASGTAHGVHVEWSTNEKVALELLFGASLAGARGLFTCKQMGLNVASDALMSLNYVSVRGGLVLVVADDPGPISSQTEQDTRRFAAFAKVPVLDPATPEQAFDMIKAAFELSERHHTPVIVRPTTRVDHASAFFDVEDETHALEVPDEGFERDTSKWVIFPRRAYQAHGEINERLVQIAHEYANDDTLNAFNVTEGAADATYGIMAGGISAAYTREALRMVADHAAEAGIDMPACRFMQIGTPYPFPEDAVAKFTAGLGEVLVIEELDFVIEDALARFAGRTHAAFNVHGKLTGEAKNRGENNVDDIVARIEKFLGLSGRLRRYRRDLLEQGEIQLGVEYPDELPVRPPVLCPGCPHRGSFYAIKQALGKTPAVMCGDIGCYTLGNAKPLDAVDTCLCMGAGITMAQGLAAVDPSKKAIAYVGDSTFFASGMTGLANAAYNGHDITVMVLDNATTAMTGTQPHPGTGQTLMGPKSTPLSIERVLNANGFTHVYHANPLDKDGSIVAAKAAIAYEGPSAVIFEAPCIQLSKPNTPVFVDADVCTGCKKCITSIGCPAIAFNAKAEGPKSKDRGQAVIDKTLCNGCDLCTQVCPFHAILTPLERTGEVGGAKGSIFADVAMPEMASVPEPPKVLDVLEAVALEAANAGASEIAGEQEPVEAAVEPKEHEVEETLDSVEEVDASEEAPESEDGGEPSAVDDAEEAEATEESPEINKPDEPAEAEDGIEESDSEDSDDLDEPYEFAELEPVAWNDGAQWNADLVDSSPQVGYKPLKLGEGPLINTVTMKDEFRTAGDGITNRVSSLLGKFGGKMKGRASKGASQSSPEEGGPDA